MTDEVTLLSLGFLLFLIMWAFTLTELVGIKRAIESLKGEK